MAAPSIQTAFDLAVTSRGKRVNLRLTPTALFVRRQDKREEEVPVRQVVGAYHAAGQLELHYLARKHKNARMALTTISGAVDGDGAAAWCEAAMNIAYEGASPGVRGSAQLTSMAGVKPSRRFKVLINPFGGQGKAGSIYDKVVAPIFAAAKCPTDVTYTTHSKHAVEIAAALPVAEYDALVVVSGDGLIHEVMNGFAAHPESDKAFALPVAHVPGGSANATSLNILGTKDGFDAAAAALNAIKGRPMKVDLFLLTQGARTTISTMSQALGLMAECDLGTESWRWMGEVRFMLGYLRGLLAFKPCPLIIQIKVAEQDKGRMVDALGAGGLGDASPCRTTATGSLPDLSVPVNQTDGWLTLDVPSVYMYAGKGPFVSRDLMQFPVSVPDDGFIDIVIQQRRNRLEMITHIDDGPKGTMFWLDSQHYFKATGYRVKFLEKSGYFAVDGESYPYTDFQVEVLKGLGTLLSPYGHYADDLVRHNGPGRPKKSA
ncbi:hypothetical protein HWV62_5867 [Athelia sp. TMB]|nr:hypothetical protein HWV62_5867 [Athelia sp. TMB]